ncbi:MAG TPA: glycine dehydrogenase, partial [Planctomycetota bacterium]|nr:glycine dehydrogenase [Planctomycetota bacterium]
MSYIANTPEQREAMLKTLGCTLEDLFAVVTPGMRPKSFALPEGKSELEVYHHLARLAGKNHS